jgi:post-GPI attachment to proteins factor 3
VTTARVARGEEVLQYHGAWPFVRVGPFIQFWSMVFSVGNLAPHALFVCFRPWRERFAPLRRLPPQLSGRPGALLYPLSPVLILHGLAGINAWFWSTVYHARDTTATQRMDVHCATLYVAFSVFVLALRILQWDPVSAPARLLALAIFGSLLLNFLYLDFVRWDFQYNLSITVTAVVLYALTGFAWVLLHRARPYAWKLGLTLALLLSAGLLEVFDFPPVLHYTLDAHAVWHLATIPLTVAWYLFLIDDTQFELARASKPRDDSAADDDAVANAPPIIHSLLTFLRSAGSVRNRAAARAPKDKDFRSVV